MLSRIIVAIIGIPILIWVLYSGGIPLLVFTNIIVGIGTYEYYRMGRLAGKNSHTYLGMILALMIPNYIFFRDKLNINFEMIIALFIVVIMSVRVLKNKVENASVEIGETLLGALYTGGLFSHILLISELENGGKWLLTAQIMVWICDSLAYFIGLSIGRKFFNRGFNSISPKKSIEGSLGGILCTTISLYFLDRDFNLVDGGLSIISIIVLGVFISLVAQIGDLGESMFKREFKIKDSGTLLRGHGGILDRFDSMLFVAPVMYYLLKLIILK